MAWTLAHTKTLIGVLQQEIQSQRALLSFHETEVEWILDSGLSSEEIGMLYKKHGDAMVQICLAIEELEQFLEELELEVLLADADRQFQKDVKEWLND